jgi:glycosyltransferase involved in cell wall biosynthesis
MSDPTVSVIVPCYRQARWLACAIDSVLAQSYKAIRLLVVNDGSDDDTEIVASRYGSLIRYINKSNGGVSSARNAGIRASEGSYLLFLDADDVLCPDAISQLVHAVEGRDHTVSLIGYCSFEGDPISGKKFSFLPPANLSSLLPASLENDPTLARPVGLLPPNAESLLPYLLYTCVWPPACLLYPRRTVLAEGGFEEQLRNCEDWDLCLRLALGCIRLATVPSVGVLYRRHLASKSTDFNRMLEARTQMLLRAHHRIVREPKLLRLWGKDLLAAEVRVCRRYLVRKKWSPKVRRLSEAINQLRECGIRMDAKGRINRFLELIPGVESERAALTYYGWFRPTILNYYLSCYA